MSDDPGPVPENDPRYIDPAGNLADAVESGDLDLSLADDQDAEDLRAFVNATESGEVGPVDPGLEAQATDRPRAPQRPRRERRRRRGYMIAPSLPTGYGISKHVPAGRRGGSRGSGANVGVL